MHSYLSRSGYEGLETVEGSKVSGRPHHSHQQVQERASSLDIDQLQASKQRLDKANF